MPPAPSYALLSGSASAGTAIATDIPLFLIELGAIILALSVLSRFASRIGFSAIPLYLLAGLALGPGGVIPLHASEEFLHIGSEIGVILLLLMLGLEYTAPELMDSLKKSKASGVIDLVLNALPGVVVAVALGWGPVAAIALGGATWISSSGVVAKMLRDLQRLGNRETPTILSILVIEDLLMAFYLPVLSAIVVGAGLLAGATTVAIAVAIVVLILVVVLRHGNRISRLVMTKHSEALLLGVLGLALLVAGFAARLNVSAAVGAFLVGIALSGEVAERAEEVLSPLRDLFAAIFFVFFGIVTDITKVVPLLPAAAILAAAAVLSKVVTGYVAAKRAGIAPLGRWRTGFALVPRGEFSIVIVSVAVSAGIEPLLAPLVTGFVLITVVVGPLLARLPDIGWFRSLVVGKNSRRRTS